MSMLYIYASVK